MNFQVQRSSRSTGGVGEFESTEAGRHITNLIRMATVKEVDLEKIRVRVLFGNEADPDSSFLSGWLPLLQPNASTFAGGVSEWIPPKVGDVVPVYCIGGEMENGQVLPSANFMTAENSPFGTMSDGYEFGPIGEARDDVWRKIFADGTLIEFDLGQNLVRVETPGSVKVYAGGQIILKSPFVQVDCDAMHVTGKLLCSDQIIGMKKDLSGNQKLDLLGDPIHLNNGGGVIGIAASLVGSVASIPSVSSAIGSFGNAGSLFANVTSQAGPLSSISSFLTDANSLINVIPSDVLGSVMQISGVSQYLGPLSSVMGFIEDPTDGFNTSNFLTFATDVANFAGVNIPSGLSDGFDFIESALNGGTLTINDVLDVATSSGLFPSDVLQKATQVQNLITSVQSTNNLSEYDPEDLINGLRSSITRISDNDLIDTIAGQQYEPLWEFLIHGDTDAGGMISQVVNNGEKNVEQLLNIAALLQRGDHEAGTSVNTNQGDNREQAQIDYSPAQTASNIKINYPTT